MKLIRMAALAALLAVCAFAQTTISDTIYAKPGTLWSGQITVSWPNFTTADGIQIAAGQTLTVVQNGALNVQLWPNIGAAPAIAYTASYFTTLAGSTTYGKAWVETWSNVPASPSTISLATARTWSSLSGNFTLHGSGAPSNTIGANGDFYLSTATTCLFGPKASNAWPNSCVSLVGPSGAGIYCPDTSVSANTLTCSTQGGSYLSYSTTQPLLVKVANANTGAVTINANGLGSKNVTTHAGAALSSGALASGGEYLLAYDGVRFQVLGGSVGASINYLVWNGVQVTWP